MKGIDTITLNYTFFSMFFQYPLLIEDSCADTIAEAKYDKNGHISPMPMPY
jgi:cytochrome c oxidase assembly protein Cox11